MAANVRFKCPVEGCDYATNFRMIGGAEEFQSEHDERFAILKDEHPNHPVRIDTSNRKPKDVLTEQMVAEDGELNF